MSLFACDHGPNVWCAKCMPDVLRPGPICIDPPPPTTGWVCPKCGACYAPFVSHCHRCSPPFDWSRVTCASTSSVTSQLAASVMSAVNLNAAEHNATARGIVFTVLQPLDASLDDYFAPLVDEALAEAAALSTDKLPHDETEWTASNGVRMRLKLIEERKPGR